MKKSITLLASLLVALGASAACVGSSTEGNSELCGAATCNEWTLGYEWGITTTESGVAVGFDIKDDLGEGLVPEIYCKKGENVTWTNALVSGNKAAAVLSGYNEGDGLTIALKVASSKGVVFTKFIGYIVGDDCGEMTGCNGHGDDTDFEYSDSRPWDKGYDYAFTTTDDGVYVAFEVLDNYDGMANPYLFDKTDPTALTEIQMNLAGNKAYCNLTGYNDGDIINVLMKMPVAGGQLMTRRIGYVVGSDCSEWEGCCEDGSTETDPVYGADPNTKEWTNGYYYSFATLESGNVALKINMFDKFAGFASPEIFIFDTKTPGHPMIGNPVPAKMFGIGAYYEFDNVSEGDEIEVLMKAGVAGGVVFTKRLSYTVGQKCGVAAEESKASSFMLYPNPVSTVLNIEADKIIEKVEIYTITGNIVKLSQPMSVNAEINLGSFAAGTYVVKTYTEDGSIKSDQIVKQ